MYADGSGWVTGDEISGALALGPPALERPQGGESSDPLSEETAGAVVSFFHIRREIDAHLEERVILHHTARSHSTSPREVPSHLQTFFWCW